MEMTKSTGLPVYEAKKPTDDELRREYNYLLAEELTKKLLERELITPDEFNKIMRKNAETFSPFISKIIR